ncbi:hypothetical protein [uncultured Rikenella sp.]|uniref:hypothetical protein n=2 Tax=uncultured Rikenella sp. TaxID=368003 RepID=UPI002606059B|nr:hypothetical protein [uncultured Rikenella sp.]
MMRTLSEIGRERSRWLDRLLDYRRTLRESGGYMSDARLAGYKTAIADCEAMIAALDEEVSKRSFNNLLNLN